VFGVNILVHAFHRLQRWAHRRAPTALCLATLHRTASRLDPFGRRSLAHWPITLELSPIIGYPQIT
jgi:hypothetical protein